MEIDSCNLAIPVERNGPLFSPITPTNFRNAWRSWRGSTSLLRVLHGSRGPAPASPASCQARVQSSQFLLGHVHPLLSPTLLPRILTRTTAASWAANVTTRDLWCVAQPHSQSCIFSVVGHGFFACAKFFVLIIVSITGDAMHRGAWRRLVSRPNSLKIFLGVQKKNGVTKILLPDFVPSLTKTDLGIILLLGSSATPTILQRMSMPSTCANTNFNF